MKKITLLSAFLCVFLGLFAQEPVEEYIQHNGRYDFVMIGDSFNGFENANTCVGIQDPDASADLNLAAGQNVIAAYLYWSGSSDNLGDAPDDFVELNGTTFAADETITLTVNGGQFFACRADVTSFIQTTGNGTYTMPLSALDYAEPNGCSGMYAGWALVVVYEDAGLTLNSVKIFDGFEVANGSAGFCSGPGQIIDITLDNLNVVNNIGAQMGFVAWEGDQQLACGEEVTFDGALLATNAFNGGGGLTPNMDLDVYDISGFVVIGDNNVNIELTTFQDQIFMQTVVVTLNNQLPDPTVTFDNVLHDNCDDRLLDVDFTVGNIEATDVLLANTPIDIYINDVTGTPIYSTVTTVDLAIGESESFSTVLDIPAAFNQDFSLIAVVNDDNGNPFYLELNPNNNEDLTDVHIITHTASTQNSSICDDEEFELPDGTLVDASDVYTSIIPNADGCDSVITTNLTVFPTYAFTPTIEVCETNSFEYPDGSPGQSVAGTYTDVFMTTTSDGCDSMITTTLIVYPEYLDLTETVPICDGDDWTLPNGTIVSEAGEYVSMLNTVAFGCDSIITTTIVVNPTYALELDIRICDGLDYELPNGTRVDTDGLYPVTLPTINGCDSLINTLISIDENYEFNSAPEICEGETWILEDGTEVSTSGMYEVNYVSARNCDSTYFTNLTVNPVYNEVDPPLEICDGDIAILPDGREISTAGQYTSDLQSVDMCDSIVTTNVIVYPTYQVTVDTFFCEGGVFELPDETEVTAPGVYVSNLLSANNCDSIVTTNLIEIATVYTEVESIFCVGDGYFLPDGTQVFEPGEYTSTLQQQLTGCDSVVLTNLLLGEVNYPTAFTPNGDGVNDIFHALPGEECFTAISDYVLRVYNSWGELVYETNDFSQGWDGRQEGLNSIPGLYTYYSSYNFDGDAREHEGGVTLIR